MLNNVDLYLFSPTGATRKAGEMLAKAMADKVNYIDLCNHEPISVASSDTAVFAMPVFSGRIPSVAADKIKAISGSGKKAVTIVVYGVRAYDDALIELNDVVTGAGFDLAASAALVARHSIVPAVGAGRPNDDDAAEIAAFAADVLKKLEAGGTAPAVPGNRPYVNASGMPVTPVSGEGCIGCGACSRICPTSAVTLENGEVRTDVEACILCLACTAVCPVKVRALPAPVQEKLNAKLSGLIGVERKNEFYI